MNNLKLSCRGGLLLALFCAGILVLALRGLPGSPTITELNSSTWKEDGPFELSPDRGRFALTYSLVEDQSLTFSLPLARFSTPDLAIRPDGQYVSLFAPGLSFLVVPGYLIGKWFGVAPLGVFAIITLFALLNAFLVRRIAMHLGASPLAASIAAVTFLFATPAFTYGVTLYQHHISVFLLLGSIYLLLRGQSRGTLVAIWLAYGAAILVDHPNIVMMFPVAVAAGLRLMELEKDRGTLRLRIKLHAAATVIVLVLPLTLLLWFNHASSGNPYQLSGTLPAVQAIDEQGLPSRPAIDLVVDPADRASSGARDKTAIGFFSTRNLLNGFYIHLFSPDRGMLFFTPVILLGMLGLTLLYQSHRWVATLLVGSIFANLLLYSMWGDPWGGWAFGSRYLIPSYAVLGIALSQALTRWRRYVGFLTIFFLLFGYSVWVNTAGAISSSRNPPRAQVLQLETLTGQEEKYTVMRNLQYLEEQGAKSFVFQTVVAPYLSARQYHAVLTLLIVCIGAGMLVVLNRRTPAESVLVSRGGGV